MEFYELKEIIAKNDLVDQLIDQYFDDETAIENLDEYIAQRNTELIGKSDLKPDEHLEYWLGVLYCRAVSNEFDATSIEVLKKLAEPETLTSVIDDEFRDRVDDISQLLKAMFSNVGYVDFIERRHKLTSGNTKWKSGDLFAIPREDGSFITGRILCAINACLKGKKSDGRTNHLVGAKNCFLVETFDGLTDKPKPVSEKRILYGVIVRPDALKNGFWLKIGEQPVQLDELDFPEYVYLDGMDDDGNKQVEFVKGELVIPIPYDEVLYEVQTSWYEIILDGYWLDGYTLYAMGDIEKVPFHTEKHDLSTIDLRYNPSEMRAKIYELIGKDASMSYKELAESCGKDLSNYTK